MNRISQSLAFIAFVASVHTHDAEHTSWAEDAIAAFIDKSCRRVVAFGKGAVHAGASWSCVPLNQLALAIASSIIRLSGVRPALFRTKVPTGSGSGLLQHQVQTSRIS